MQLDLEQLRTLRAVVEHGTLDAAAAALHVTPSAVSQRLKALETTAGRVLLVRSKPVRPTPAGETVLRMAGEVAIALHREDEANTVRLLRAGTVVAAITYDAAPVAGCTVTSLGVMRYRPMATKAFVRRWLPGGPSGEALAAAPMMVFDRDDALQTDYLQSRAPGADPPQTMVPSSTDFVQAIALGMGWGVPD